MVSEKKDIIQAGNKKLKKNKTYIDFPWSAFVYKNPIKTPSMKDIIGAK